MTAKEKIAQLFETHADAIKAAIKEHGGLLSNEGVLVKFSDQERQITPMSELCLEHHARKTSGDVAADLFVAQRRIERELLGETGTTAPALLTYGEQDGDFAAVVAILSLQER